jgi:hypothetical protein
MHDWDVYAQTWEQLRGQMIPYFPGILEDCWAGFLSIKGVASPPLSPLLHRQQPNLALQ